MSQGSKKLITPEDASRIQSREARQHDGKVSKDGFTSRAMSGAQKNVNKGRVPESK